jgi:hypothetical protein
MKKIHYVVLCAAVLLSFFATVAGAREVETTPRVLKFNASLASDFASRFEPGVVALTFSIYKERDDETPLWIGTQNVTIDENGRFTVLLGEDDKDGVPLELFTSGDARWLGIQRVPERERERVLLASVPYAIKASDADTLGGKPLSAFVLADETELTTTAGEPGKKKKPVVNGVAGFIPKFTDTTNIDNSILFESAGKIGLSTTSPQGPLHINSVVTFRNAGVGSIQTGNNPGILLENPASNSTVLLSESFGLVVFVKTSATAPLVGSDQRFVIRPTGNVGIGINNPQAPLHISGTQNYRNLNVGSVQSGTNPGIMLENPATNSTVALTENNGLSIYAKPSASQTFSNSDLRLVMTPFGDVGIGVSSPTQKLDVAGTINLSGNVVMPATSFFSGNIYLGGFRFMHAFGTGNTFLGQDAGNGGVTGQANTGIGFHALMNVAGGAGNTAVGQLTLTANNSGHDNTAIGAGSLNANLSGIYNTAVGSATLATNSVGSNNTALGKSALSLNTSGDNNTALGSEALVINNGSYNFAGGAFALHNNQGGSNNVSVGALSLQTNTAGNSNVAVGADALYTNNADNNVAVGGGALFLNTTGVGNIGIGNGGGQNLTTGNDNIDIGNNGVAAESGTIRIGSSNQSKTFISGIRNVTTGAANAVAVLIDSNGQLGTVSSSRRYKFDIADMSDATEGLMRLRPVTFRYLQHGADGPLQYGLIAEEVAEVYPELVAHDKSGAVETVMYQFLTPMLLNEVQKQQKTIEMLAQRLEALEAEIAKGRATDR